MPQAAVARRIEDDVDGEEDHALWAQFQAPPPDPLETLADDSVAEKIGWIISCAMMKGPWTGC